MTSVNCPGCTGKIFELTSQVDGFLCDICNCIWEITKHDIEMGDKIDLE